MASQLNYTEELVEYLQYIFGLRLNCFYVRILKEFVLLMSLTMTATACIAFNLKRFSLQTISLLILKQNLNQYSKVYIGVDNIKIGN
jgi:hypothetical protein